MRRRVLVKICGVTLVRDATFAAALGADFIGLNFFRGSPRFVTARRARAIADRVRGDVRLVGVFVNASEAAIRKVIDDIGLDLVQLHGDETPEFVRSLGDIAFKAFPLATRRDLDKLGGYPCPNFHVVDARSKVRGGSGKTANWRLAKEAARKHRILLAGGLTAENVALAIREVQPAGVDVASGVESAPGIKDARLVDAFIRSAKSGR